MSTGENHIELIDQSGWGELYSYLLGRLREMGLFEVVNEVELATSTRITEEGAYSLQLFDHAQDMDTTISRAQRPNEAFNAAFKVLETRLHEVPALIDALDKRLGKPSTQVQWLPDAGPNDIASQFERFSGADFVLSTSEREEVESALKHFNQLLTSAIR